MAWRYYKETHEILLKAEHLADLYSNICIDVLFCICKKKE